MMTRIPIAEPLIEQQELDNVLEAVRSGWISSIGRFITCFEQGFAQYCGVKYGVATSNGTSALHLALATLDIGSGDEVIVPDLTFIATANAVTFTGAIPILTDSHPQYWCLDPEQIEKKITPRTKAIIPVHLYGHPCDMESIQRIADKYHLFVIEDAAEAHGASYQGRKVGGFGDIACFSFFGNKIITTGEGGICVTDNKYLEKKMRLLRDHGKNPERPYWHDVIGFNYRMTNLQAAIGVAQLDKIDSMIQKKQQLSQWYAEALSGLTDRKLIRLQPQMPWASSVCWMFSITVEDEFGITSSDLRSRLSSISCIETRPLFYPLHMLPPYQNPHNYPNAESLNRQGISLPSGYNIEKEDITHIAQCIVSICPNYS